MIDPCGDRWEFRVAGPADAPAIAALHAASWRRHYRGAYNDEFLDGDVVPDRLAVWTDRLAQPDRGRATTVAEFGSATAGFAHVVFDADPTWGALLENIHVGKEHQRSGIGSSLLSVTARSVTARHEHAGLHLWVLEQNLAAQAFYEAHGAKRAGRSPVPPPGGIPRRLTGSPHRLRYAWEDAASVGRASIPDSRSRFT
jgi:ribosomal protein S18 acetylase RimI-like enzyme